MYVTWILWHVAESVHIRAFARSFILRFDTVLTSWSLTELYEVDEVDEGYVRSTPLSRNTCHTAGLRGHPNFGAARQAARLV